MDNHFDTSFLPAHILDFAARTCVAGDLPGLSVGSLRALAVMHEERGELLSAEQYTDMADDKEATEKGG